MSSHPPSQRSRWNALSLAGLGTLALAGGVLLPFASAASQKEAGEARQVQSDAGMKCPMMAGMKDVKLHVDSPPLLTARADVLELSDDQQEQLKSIAEEARSKARAVLTDEQKAQLSDQSGALSMMEIARLRMKETKQDGGRKMMCPMCSKMMSGQNADRDPETEAEERRDEAARPPE